MQLPLRKRLEMDRAGGVAARHLHELVDESVTLVALVGFARELRGGERGEGGGGVVSIE